MILLQICTTHTQYNVERMTTVRR